MPLNYDPGGSTSIRISWETREMIEIAKLIPREPLDDCLKRIIIENLAFHQIEKMYHSEPMPSTENPK